MAMNGGIFFGPTNLGGSPIDMPTFVRPFSPEFSRSTNHRIPSIFCMKLVCSKSKTEFRFSNKNKFGYFRPKFVPNSRFGHLVIFLSLSLNHSICFILHIGTDRHDI